MEATAYKEKLAEVCSINSVQTVNFLEVAFIQDKENDVKGLSNFQLFLIIQDFYPNWSLLFPLQHVPYVIMAAVFPHTPLRMMYLISNMHTVGN